jgi:hypothetical protein
MEENRNTRSPNSPSNSRVLVSRLAINGTTKQTDEGHRSVFGHANKSNRSLRRQLHALRYRAKHRNIKHHHAIRSGNGWPGMQVDSPTPILFLENVLSRWIIFHPKYEGLAWPGSTMGRRYSGRASTAALTRFLTENIWGLLFAGPMG